jgi:hypothetical protein
MTEAPNRIETSTLQRAASARRVQALFRAMSTDYLLREQFVTDPAQVMSEYLYGKVLSLDQASAANQLIYSVMSNQALLNWVREYAISHRGRVPPEDKIATDFGHAVVQHGGDHVVVALMRAAGQEKDVRVLNNVLLEALFNGGIFADDPGTGGQEGTGPGTNPVTGDPETEKSPGTDDGGTQQSTGTGSTERSGSFFGANYVLTLEAIVSYANHLEATGALEVAAF